MATKPKKTPSKRKLRKNKKTGGKGIASVVAGLITVLFAVAASIGVLVWYNNQPTSPHKPTTQERADAVSAKPKPPQTALTTSQARPADDTLARFEGSPSHFNPELAYEPGEVVLADPPAGFENTIRAEGFKITEYVNLTALDMQVVRVVTPPDMSVKDAIRLLSRLLPGVDIDANHHFDPSAAPGSNAREMAGWHDLSPACGKGLVIGQIDSGVDLKHPALVGQKIHHKAFPQSGRKPGPAGHGTAIAAMLVGKASWGGLLPGAELYAANMFEINAEGKIVGSSVGLLKAINWLASHKVHAVNMSVAGNDNSVVRKALQAAQRAKLMLVASAGNWGSEGKPAYPAAYKEVIAVTATHKTELIYSHANQGDYIDFAAPGVAIYTAQPGGGGKVQSGTSFAAPYLTAISAVLVQAKRTMDAETLRQALSKTTRDLGKPGKDKVFGYGYVMARPVCH